MAHVCHTSSLTDSIATYISNDFIFAAVLGNVYPFFPSGSIIVSNIETGLFVLQLNTSVVTPTLQDPQSIATLGTCDRSNKDKCQARNNLSEFLVRFFGRKGYSASVPMYKHPLREGGILCRERCIEESNIPTMIRLGWKCGVCL